MPQKYRVEVSEDLHRALKLSADLHRQELREYAAPFLEAAIDPRIRDLLAGEAVDDRPKEFCDISPKKEAEYHRTTQPPGPQNSDITESKDPVTLAKAYILAELEAGREPTAQEVAEVVEMESRPLGALMRAAGFENQVCRRDGIQARRYTLDMIDSFRK